MSSKLIERRYLRPEVNILKEFVKEKIFWASIRFEIQRLVLGVASKVWSDYFIAHADNLIVLSLTDNLVNLFQLPNLNLVKELYPHIATRFLSAFSKVLRRGTLC